MKQSPQTISTKAILALALSQQHVSAFAPPTQRCRALTAATAPAGSPRPRAIALRSSQMTLELIMENPDSFPNTSRILRSLSNGDSGAGADYKEFLAVLSEEWMRYTTDSEEVASMDTVEDEWSMASSTPKIASAVGAVSGYATVQAEDYVHHYGEYSSQLWAMQPEQQYPADSYEQHFTSADSTMSNNYNGEYLMSSSYNTYEPHPYLSQNYHYGESSPNVLRDLAKSLPPPVDEYSDGMAASASYYDAYSPHQDGSLHYVADGSLGDQFVVVANYDVPQASEVMASVQAVPIEEGSSTISDTAADMANSLSSQLSDITYAQSFGQADTASKRFAMPQFPKLLTPEVPSSANANEVISRVKEFSSHSTESINQALSEAKEAGSSQLNHLFGSISHPFEGLSEKVASIKSSSVESIGRAVGDVKVPSFDTAKIPGLDTSKISSFDMSRMNIPKLDVLKMPSMDMSKMKLPSAPAMPNVDVSKVKLPSAPAMPNFDVSKLKMPSVPSMSGFKSGLPAESTGVAEKTAASTAHYNFADASLSDIGHSIFDGIKYIGGILFQFLDWMIGAVVGTNLSQILGSVVTSVTSLIENASSSVVNTLNGLGNMTLKEVLQAFLTILLVIVDIILKVSNALVYLISGKDAGDWALQANSAVHTYGDELLAQAGAAYHDVTHKSLGELASSIGDYSNHVGEELLAMMNGLSTQVGDVAEGVMSGAGDVSYLSAENLDTIASAVQTALTL